MSSEQVQAKTIERLTDFKADDSLQQIIIDGNGTSYERFQIHQCAKTLGLISTTVTEEKSTHKLIVISKNPGIQIQSKNNLNLIPTNQCKIDQITISDDMIITFTNLTNYPLPVP